MVGDLIGRHRQKQAIGEAMRLAIEANAYLSQQAPWKLRTTDPARMATVLHVACQAVDDINRILAPFLPFSAETVHRLIGRTGRLHGEPRIEIVDDLDGGPSYPVITGDYARPGALAVGADRARHAAGRADPVFAKLDPAVVDEELARLEAQAG